VVLQVGDGPTSLDVADLNGDRKPDIVIGHANEPSVGWLLQR
jgi:hypothetical protein